MVKLTAIQKIVALHYLHNYNNLLFTYMDYRMFKSMGLVE